MSPQQTQRLANIETILKTLAEQISSQDAALRFLIAQGNKIMSGESDLKAAIATLTSAVAAAVANIQTLMNNAAGDPDADIETLAQQVNAQAAALQAAIAPATAAASAPSAQAKPTS
jgi:peptidoglycan hydrolase CwlO-like protein